MTDAEVIVAGGGPAGAATAARLAAERRRTCSCSTAPPSRATRPAPSSSRPARSPRWTARRAARGCRGGSVAGRHAHRRRARLVHARATGTAAAGSASRGRVLDHAPARAARTAGAEVHEADGRGRRARRGRGRHRRSASRRRRSLSVALRRRPPTGCARRSRARSGSSASTRWPRRSASWRVCAESRRAARRMAVGRGGYCGVAAVGGGEASVGVAVSPGTRRPGESAASSSSACSPRFRPRARRSPEAPRASADQRRRTPRAARPARRRPRLPPRRRRGRLPRPRSRARAVHRALRGAELAAAAAQRGASPSRPRAAGLRRGARRGAFAAKQRACLGFQAALALARPLRLLPAARRNPTRASPAASHGRLRRLPRLGGGTAAGARRRARPALMAARIAAVAGALPPDLGNPGADLGRTVPAPLRRRRSCEARLAALRRRAPPRRARPDRRGRGGVGHRGSGWSASSRRRCRWADRRSPSAFERAEVDKTDIDLLTVVSCTGYATPGLDILLARDLGLRGNVQRLHVGHMGCYAALPTLAVVSRRGRRAREDRGHALPRADDAAHPAGRARASSRSWRTRSSGMRRRRPCGARRLRPRVRRRGGRDRPHGAEQMTWDVTDRGFRMGLSPKVPASVREHVAPVVDALLGRNGLARGDVGRWASTPAARHRGRRRRRTRPRRRGARALTRRPARDRQLLVGDDADRPGAPARRRARAAPSSPSPSAPG